MNSSEALPTTKTDHEFMKLKANPNHYDEDYEFGVGCFCRRIFLKNTILELLKIRSRLK